MLTLLLSLFALAAAEPKSTKMNSRLLCEACHALGNYTTHEFYTVGSLAFLNAQANH